MHYFVFVSGAHPRPSLQSPRHPRPSPSEVGDSPGNGYSINSISIGENNVKLTLSNCYDSVICDHCPSPRDNMGWDGGANVQYFYYCIVVTMHGMCFRQNDRGFDPHSGRRVVSLSKIHLPPKKYW